MKMQVSKALEIRSALQNCDGYQALVKEGDTQKSVFVLHELGFAVRFAIAKNLEALDKVSETYTKTRNDMIKSMSKNGTGIDPKEEPDTVAAFLAKDRENLESEIEVPLEMIQKSNLEKSNLPVAVLATIMPIIKE